MSLSITTHSVDNPGNVDDFALDFMNSHILVFFVFSISGFHVTHAFIIVFAIVYRSGLTGIRCS